MTPKLFSKLAIALAIGSTLATTAFAGIKLLTDPKIPEQPPQVAGIQDEATDIQSTPRLPAATPTPTPESPTTTPVVTAGRGATAAKVPTGSVSPRPTGTIASRVGDDDDEAEEREEEEKRATEKQKKQEEERREAEKKAREKQKEHEQ